MPKKSKNEQVIWTPQMPDRRKKDRRDNTRDFYPNGKSMNISDLKNTQERRNRPDRRKKVSVTITGRAIDVEE